VVADRLSTVRLALHATNCSNATQKA
jgi:hypothetical protein